MPDLSPEAQDKVAKLKDEYLISLQERLSILGDCWQQLNSESYDENTLSAFRTGCHKLAGSAGSFGFDEISRVARSLEKICKGLTVESHSRDELVKFLGLGYQKLTDLIREKINR